MAAQDLATRRHDMVLDQLVGRGLADRRVLDAMSTVPRELFVTAGLREEAYADKALPIGGEQTISQPYIIALVLQELGLRGGETVLEVGTGSGYSAAVLSLLAGDVVTVERDPDLARTAADALRSYGTDNVEVVVGDGSKGRPESAPFGAIAVHALAPRVPQALVDQLSVGARMVLPVAGEGVDRLTVLTRTETGTEHRTLEPVRFVPLVSDT